MNTNTTRTYEIEHMKAAHEALESHTGAARDRLLARIEEMRANWAALSDFRRGRQRVVGGVVEVYTSAMEWTIVCPLCGITCSCPDAF